MPYRGNVSVCPSFSELRGGTPRVLVRTEGMTMIGEMVMEVVVSSVDLSLSTESASFDESRSLQTAFESLLPFGEKGSIMSTSEVVPAFWRASSFIRQ